MSDEHFEYVLKVIRSCRTEGHFESCRFWVTRLGLDCDVATGLFRLIRVFEIQYVT